MVGADVLSAIIMKEGFAVSLARHIHHCIVATRVAIGMVHCFTCRDLMHQNIHYIIHLDLLRFSLMLSLRLRTLLKNSLASSLG